jgi:hypothetical protein
MYLNHQRLTVSWQMSMPRSCSRSSTVLSDSGYLTYIITINRITSGELSNQRNGSGGVLRRGMTAALPRLSHGKVRFS